MSRRPALVVLLCIASLNPACRCGGSTDRPRPATQEPADAGDAGDASTGPSRADSLEIFLEAARTNLERPYPASSPEAPKLYADAARPLLDRDPPRDPAMIVLLVLDQWNDERAARALVDWATSPGISPSNLSGVLSVMRGHPRAMYLEAVRAALANEDLAGIIVSTNGGAFRKNLGMEVHVSMHVVALELAAALPGDDGRALLRRIAEDRKASAPNPRTLAALSCPRGTMRVEQEARAIASLRIMSLSILDDPALLRKVGDDPTEHSLVRYWSRRMAQGRPDEDHMDARQKRAYLRTMEEPYCRDGGLVTPKWDVSPCW